jgi:hypothetical protein
VLSAGDGCSAVTVAMAESVAVEDEKADNDVEMKGVK